jgi:chemotaxis protein MotA
LDIATIIGLVLGIACVLFGMITGGGDMMQFWDPASVFITIGGAVSATVMSFPLSNLAKLGGAIKAGFIPKKIDLNHDIDMIIDIANVARKEGLLALEDAVATMQEPFLKKGIMLMVDGSDPELIKSVLETELSYIEARHSIGSDMLMTLSSYGPAFGMIGTLIGLIQMLGGLDDPSNLGAGMSKALITTLYGSMIANMFATPLGKKLRVRSGEEILEKELLMEGLLSIQDGENPRIIRDKLTSFISRKEAEKASSSSAGGRQETAEA